MSDRQPSGTDPATFNIRPPSFQRRFIASETDDPDTLVALASDESYFVRRQVVRNPNTPAWILELLVRAGATPDLRGKGDRDPDLDPDSLRHLVETGPWARQLVAEHPNTSAEVLAVLAKQSSVPLRKAVTVHTNADAAILASLCCDIEDGIRTAAAMHPNCSADLFRLMIAAGATGDLQQVTRHFQHLSVAQITLLAGLGPWGRFLAARHPDCPADVLTTISVDPDWRVRSGLLDNPHCPDTIIKILVDTPDSNEMESIRTLGRVQIPVEIGNELAMHPSPEVRLALARHLTTAADILAILATDGVKEIRRLAASHPNTDAADLQRLVLAGSTPDLMGLSEPDSVMPPDEIQDLLAGGVWARQLAVRHPNTDAETLAHLLCDREPKIREWAAVHPGLSPETKQNLIRAGSGTDFQGIMPPDPKLSADELRRISQLGSWGEWVVANNPYAPEDLLDSLSHSDDWQVRMFIARNPSTSLKTVIQLVKDPIEEVQLAVGTRDSFNQNPTGL